MSLFGFILLGAVLGLGAWAVIRFTPLASLVSGDVPAVDTNAIQLSLTCDTINLPIPLHGEIWSVDTLFKGALMKISLGSASPDGWWPEDGIHGTGFKCVIKNFGSSAAFGVTVPITMSKREVDEQGGMRTSGKVIEEHHAKIVVPYPLGQGQDSFTFYICNYSKDRFIGVSFPSTAFINDDEAGTKEEIPLRVHSIIGMPMIITPYWKTQEDTKIKKHGKGSTGKR